MIKYRIIRDKDKFYKVQGIFLGIFKFWVKDKWFHNDSIKFYREEDILRYCQKFNLYPLKPGIFDEN